MAIYKIVVAYDGTRYHGWQTQPNATTICQVLTDSFYSMFFKSVSILGASRTDKGVHAYGQVAIAQTELDISVEVLKRVWNKILPEDINIVDIVALDKLVHPHDGVVQKIYAYHFFLDRPMPRVARYGWYVSRNVDMGLLHQALAVVVGTHDFRSFCTGDDLVDTVRTIDSITLSFVAEWNAYKIEVKGKSFLRYMVRRIVGACIDIARREKWNIKDLIMVLENKNPKHTLPNAPAKGLVLERIVYEEVGESS